jgi:tRNA G18 (ribose-2'-O)-methylase SpoU
MIEPVDHSDDPRLADYRDVKDPAWLRERGLFLAEGRVCVRALLHAPDFTVRSILATDAALESLTDALDPAPSVPIYRVPRSVMDAVSGVRFHQGCVAAGERRVVRPVAELLGTPDGDGLVVVLEQVSDPDNVGSIFRSALAFGVRALLLTPGTANPLYRKAIRTSMGATLQIPFAELADWPADLEQISKSDYALYALTPDAAAADIVSVPRPRRLALALGTEGFGLSANVMECAEQSVRIPMHEGANSLNVATAAAIALHQFSTLAGES